MKILIIHISDIHIKTAEDPILSRAQAIVDAVKNIEHAPAAVICICSGDVSHSGKDAQYLAAIGFFGALSSALKSQLPPNVSFGIIIVPGNHDCDFTEGTVARDTLLSSAREKPEQLAETSFANVCLAPQQRFFEFKGTIGHLKPVELAKIDQRVYAEYLLTIGSESVRFFCCNTAISSGLHEQPGSLIFPFQVIPSKRHAGPALCVGVLHHPYHWFEPASGRGLRVRLEAITDVILTGHEHMADRRKSEAHGANNAYIEGGVLQESGNPDRSEFVALVVDTQEKKQRVLSFCWKGDHYAALNCEDPNQYHLWEDFAQNRLRLRGSFTLLPTFGDYLEDLEITLRHRVKGTLHLSDVYIYPDLKRVNFSGEKNTKIIRGEGVPEFVGQSPSLFIVGDDLAGKTALAKTLFRHLRERGDVPVLIDGAQTSFNGRNTEEQIERCFKINYEADGLTAYRQLDRAKRVLLVDNYHRLRVGQRIKGELLAQFRQHAFRIIIFTHDFEITLRDVGEGADAIQGELPFAYYSILPFGLKRRNQFIEKWLELGGHDTSALQFVQHLERLRRMVDTLVGKNYVPAYPAYILSVLQASDAGTEIDLRASTHGYLYELFIKTAIARSASPLAFNVLSVYLAHVARWMFENQRTDISEVELRALHTRLHDEFEVLPEFSRHVEQLEGIQILHRDRDRFLFRHHYIRYYFLALFFRDHLAEDAVRADVEKLARDIYKEDAANTLLFLSYLSKDKFILETLLGAASTRYPNLAQAELDGEVKFVNEMDGPVEKIAIEDKPLDRSRAEELEILDEERSVELELQTVKKGEFESEETFLGRLNGALKTLQVLGQFLKNFPADLNRANKDRIISACTSLARRTMTEFLDLIKQNEAQIVDDMVCFIGRRRRGLDVTKVRERAASAVVGLCEMAVTGIVMRVTYALGSSELSATYDRIFPSAREPIMRLFYIALQLEHYRDFPEHLVDEELEKLHKNPFAYRILRALVCRYLALFPADFRLKQRLSEKLKLDFQRVSNPRAEQQLITEA